MITILNMDKYTGRIFFNLLGDRTQLQIVEVRGGQEYAWGLGLLFQLKQFDFKIKHLY